MATTMSQTETYGIELDTLSRGESSSSVHLSLKTSDDLAERNAAQLPRVDGGFGAWTFLISSWFLETFVWGLGFSAGTIQAYLASHAPFNESSLAAISSIGTLALGIEYILPLGVILIYRRYPDYARTMLVTSALVNVLAMLASSFAQKVWILIVLQGVVCGISGSFLYTPVILYLQEWFVAKRGLASGIIFSGAGVGGFCFPLLLGALLDRVGFAWTCRVWAMLTFVIYAGCVATLKPRLPVVKPARGERGRFLPLDWSWAWHPVVIVTCILSLLASLSFFPISLYMTIFVESVSSSTISANVVLACFNATAVFSQVAVGWASDRVSSGMLLMGLGLASGLVACLALGFADSLGDVVGFAVLYGSFAGGVSTWAAIARDVAGKNSTNAMFIFCQFSIFRGLASIAGPLVSAALYQQEKSHDRDAFGSFGFREIIIFVSTMAFASAGLGVLLDYTKRKTLKND